MTKTRIDVLPRSASSREQDHGIRIAGRLGRRTLLARTMAAAVITTGLGLGSTAALAQDQVLNLYSARHYQTDEQLYGNFTKETGIKINRIELGDGPLLERMKSEGAKSPADVVLLVDAARLTRAADDGLFQPI